MAFFARKETPAQNIAFCALAAAFDAILSLVGALLPLSSVFLMAAAPLIASFVAYFCQKRYHALYLFSALGISIAVSAWDFQNALFYLLPCLCSGLVYGYGVRTKAPASFSLFLSSLCQFLFFILSLYLVKAIYQVNMVDVLLAFFGKERNPASEAAIVLLGLAYSFGASGIAHFVFILVSPKLGIPLVWKARRLWVHPCFCLASSLLSFAFLFLYPPLAYFFLGISLYWVSLSLVEFAPKAHWGFYALSFLLLFASILLFAFLYPSLSPVQGFGMIALFPAALSLSCFLEVLLGKKKSTH